MEAFMNRRKSWAMLLAIGVGLTPAPGEAQTILQYQFKEGEKILYRLERKTCLAIDVKGFMIPAMFLDESMDLAWTTQKVDQRGHAKLSVKVEQPHIRMVALSEYTYIVDTDHDQKSPFRFAVSQMEQSFSGLVFEATSDRQGKLQSGAPRKKPSGLLSFFSGRDPLGPDTMQAALGPLPLVLPEGNVAKGMSWRQKVTAAKPQRKGKEQIRDLDVRLTYQGALAKDGATLAKIAVELGDDQVSHASRLREYTGTGTAYFDTATGRLVEFESWRTWNIETGSTTVWYRLKQKAEKIPAGGSASR